MKKFLKSIVANILGWQVRRLSKKNNFKVIAITGSIGKTSTKFAIAGVLGQKYRVLYQEGNYNDPVSAPLVFFNRALPNIFNPLAWLKVFWHNERMIAKAYPYDAVIAELGTDAPGQVRQMAKHLRADIALITAVTPEHMEYFDDLDEVAKEELSIAGFAKRLWINTDLIDKKYLSHAGKFSSYAIKQPADVRVTNIKFREREAGFDILLKGKLLLSSNHQKITEPQLYSVAAAAAVGHELGLEPQQIDAGIRQIEAVSGRMQQLKGINNSLIIDDTYNASPEAMRAALDTLYRLNAKQKVAVLGNMNELGKYSEDEHRQIGRYCDPEKLNLVVTIGPDANNFLAQEATLKGCNVKTFDSPFEAGEYLKTQIKDGAVVLVKGSQNRVFAEETVKLILADPADSKKLVRQSPYWLKVKETSFKK